MQKQRVEFMIRLLTQDIEADYMQAHICIGLGFKHHTLCKAKHESQQEAQELNPEDAAERVRELNEEWVHTTIK